jgi:hypothetical protein
VYGFANVSLLHSPSHTYPLVRSSLVGVSPEFEMALYTMCFLNGKEENHVQVGPYQCNIKCFTFGRGSNVKIGSAFPEALPLTDEQAATKLQAMVRGHQTRHRTGRPAPPPPSLDAWGPPPGQAAAPAKQQPVQGQPQGNAWAKPLTSSSTTTTSSSRTTTTTTVRSDAAPAGGAWGKPHKW